MSSSLVDVNGIGPETEAGLVAVGVSDVAALAVADIDTLVKVHGIGPTRAEQLRREAIRLTGSLDESPDAPEDDAKRLRKEAKELSREAKRLTKRAKTAKSKKKRKRRLRKAAELRAKAVKKKRKAKKIEKQVQS